VIDINEDSVGKMVLVRARVHNTRSKGNNCFIVLREQFSTVQAVAFKSETMTKDQIKYMAGVPSESIVDIEGTVEKPDKPIESCSQKVEIKIHKFFVVNRAANQLPLQIEDASKKVVGKEFDYAVEEKEEEAKEGDNKEIRVKLKTRLDNRVIDLRTTAKQAIFRISSGVCSLFREYLDKNGFI
jgi:aspartyl/asparaginyl-tRNA synthetase